MKVFLYTQGSPYYVALSSTALDCMISCLIQKTVLTPADIPLRVQVFFLKVSLFAFRIILKLGGPYIMNIYNSIQQEGNFISPQRNSVKI